MQSGLVARRSSLAQSRKLQVAFSLSLGGRDHTIKSPLPRRERDRVRVRVRVRVTQITNAPPLSNSLPPGEREQ